MVDSTRLVYYIDKSGLKKQHIARQLDISVPTLWRKINGTAEFKVSEVVKLCNMLDIREDGLKARIFLCDKS